MTNIFVFGIHKSLNYLVNRVKLKMNVESIKRTGQMFNKSALKFEEIIKRRLENSEIVVSDISKYFTGIWS
ncbi:hypothetical protein CEXT_799511 [Caerostris extrusa]|uniref:Uncharacterized protein n=1 Tax=Caerostris extrusa TaxID=172846 RepID=A0AAV4NN67_CAEEX|nr:hypothetical protein CEXT_799511 [Caerostris extrusa]